MVYRDATPNHPTIPTELTTEPLDFVMFCSEQDQQQAESFLGKVVWSCAQYGYTVNGCMYNDHRFTQFGSELDTAKIMSSLAVQKWFYVTDDFLDDMRMKLHKDECIMKAILGQDRTGCFVPIFTKKKTEFKELPYGFMAYKGLDVGDGKMGKKLSRMFLESEHTEAKESIRQWQARESQKWFTHERF